MSYTEKQKRQHTIELQKYLNTVSDLPPISPDGIYGEDTIAAVSEFQRTHDLSETGSTDPETWDAIVKEYREMTENMPSPYNVFPSKEHICRLGAEGVLVCVIQTLLLELGLRYDNIRRLEVSGKFTVETSMAVEEFQNIVRLPITGEVDVKTWNMLVKFDSHTENN